MPLYSIAESERRDACKRSIEALELWLRRLVDQKLSPEFGAEYLNATKANGERLINSKIARNVEARIAHEPKRYARAIDAALLEDVISIVCNPELFSDYFHDAFKAAFPDGRQQAHTILKRLIAPRNALYHANPISVHDAYRVLCYTQDIIDGLKVHYRNQNTNQQFNVPTVIRINDSMGHESYLSSPERLFSGFAMLDYSREETAFLRCGDTISIEVDIDPTFDPNNYTVHWLIANVGGPATFGVKFTLQLTEQYVSARFCVCCRVISTAKWHKLGTHDDQVDIAYRVLPPI